MIEEIEFFPNHAMLIVSMERVGQINKPNLTKESCSYLTIIYYANKGRCHSRMTKTYWETLVTYL